MSACANPAAAFFGQPITVDDVLESRLIAAPLHLLEIVMPCSGGAAFVVTTAERARDCTSRGVRVAGFGERLTHKTPTYAAEMPRTPVRDFPLRVGKPVPHHKMPAVSRWIRCNSVNFSDCCRYHASMSGSWMNEFAPLL